MDNNQDCEIIGDNETDFDVTFKIILIGDSGVGKSNLTLRGAKNSFEESHNATVGFEFLSMLIKIGDKTIKLQIWDTCGQEIYRSLITSFYKSSSLALVVYSVDRFFLNKQRELYQRRVVAEGNKVKFDSRH